MHECTKIAVVDAGNRDILGIIDSLSFVKVNPSGAVVVTLIHFTALTTTNDPSP